MFRKIIHTILAVSIAVFTTGFTLNVHYCQDRIFDLAVNAPAHSCCDPASKRPCHKDNTMNMAGHCQDESIQVRTEDLFLASSFNLQAVDDHPVDLFYFNLMQTATGGAGNRVQPAPPWYRKPPPCSDVDLTRIQSFLI